MVVGRGEVFLLINTFKKIVFKSFDSFIFISSFNLYFHQTLFFVKFMGKGLGWGWGKGMITQ